jgi:hypothetical protein
MMEALQTPETWVYFYETTWCYIPEGSIFAFLVVYFSTSIGHHFISTWNESFFWMSSCPEDAWDV